MAQRGDTIYLFNQNTIEIRHVNNGALIQSISGAGISCTWDGRMVIPEDFDEKQGLHAVMEVEHANLAELVPLRLVAISDRSA